MQTEWAPPPTLESCENGVKELLIEHYRVFEIIGHSSDIYVRFEGKLTEDTPEVKNCTIDLTGLEIIGEKGNIRAEIPRFFPTSIPWPG